MSNIVIVVENEFLIYEKQLSTKVYLHYIGVHYQKLYLNFKYN